MNESALLWIFFNAFIVLMLVLDLGVFHRKSHKVSVKEALVWTGVWVSLAFAFNVFVYYYLGEKAAFEFFTGYVIEKSLSIDNIFVFIMIFAYFNVPAAAQHKVLFWGIIGALIMRVIFIVIGIELIHQFHWLIYVFGIFLVYTGICFITQDDAPADLKQNSLVKLVRRFFRVTTEFKGNNFFVKIDRKLWATPLFVVVILIEASDLMFAVDSIPAILAISEDSFIVYTSNVFAILGLRSLYFALSGIERYFRHLKYGLATVLIFVGIKMCMTDFYKIPVELSLAFIIATLGLTMLTSMALQRRSDKVSSNPSSKT